MSKVSEVRTAIKSVDGKCSEDAARAAIRALRVPTPAMLAAAAKAGPAATAVRHQVLGGILLAEYQAAIDAAQE